uniref:Uncharacterized protein n=1 Tax=Rhizophora mucronata TaxID=61149 RepID=A0A2P2N0C0_RHIMU
MRAFEWCIIGIIPTLWSEDAIQMCAEYGAKSKIKFLTF